MPFFKSPLAFPDAYPMLIIDTETTGLYGYPRDRVLEIGIAEFENGRVSPVYSEVVRYGDIKEFDSAYVNPNGTRGIWIYRHSDLSMEDTLKAEKDLDTAVREVRRIVSGRRITSYNIPFDLGRFLYREPWNLEDVAEAGEDVMDMATARIYGMAESESIEDKDLQKRLLRERAESRHPDKWIRLEDAYRVLCPDDPLDLDRQTHRALDDAMAAAWVLKRMSEE